jgi:hypothetical protein
MQCMTMPCLPFLLFEIIDRALARLPSANGVIMGGIGGIPLVSTTQKVWRVSQALGDILFAYPFSLVLLEIEVRACVRYVILYTPNQLMRSNYLLPLVLCCVVFPRTR